MRKFIEERVNVISSGYVNDRYRITSDYKTERESIEVYKGRELLELIQNADDELIESLEEDKKEIKITFLDDILKVSNNGTPFSQEGIVSLMYSHVSSKTKSKGVIGNKGTGFRSILGWAKEIRILSGELNIVFSHNYAQEKLQTILKDTTDAETIKRYIGATLVFPKWVDDISDKEFTTEISIHITKDEEVVSDIEKQLSNIDGELLLFLNRARKLTIETKDKKITFFKEVISDNKVIIKKYENNEIYKINEWFLNSTEGEYEGEYYGVKIAYNQEQLDKKKQVLYSYFPTDIEFPYPVLLHANFNLNSDRNHLIKNDKANQFILSKCCRLLIDTAIALTNDFGVTYEPLLVLAKQKALSIELLNYEFEEILLDEIRQGKIFPTVNGKYISFKENPKFYGSNTFEYLEGEGFDNLLIGTEKREICELISALNYGSYPKYEVMEFVDKINLWGSKNLFSEEIIEKHANCIYEFLNEYHGKSVPSLIFDSKNNLLDINNEETIYLNDRSNMMTIPPDFFKIHFMHPYMREKFEELIDGNSRSISSFLSKLNVREYNTIRIIESINKIIRQLVINKEYVKAKSYWELSFKWVWENREIICESTESTEVLLLTRTGEFRSAKDLYMGKEYNCKLCEELLGQFANELFLYDINALVCNDDFKQWDLVEFLKKIGVSTLPKYYEENLNPDKYYRRKLFAEVKYPITIGWDIFENIESLEKAVKNTKVKVENIEFLPEILLNCSTGTILEWIGQDSYLLEHLYSKKELINTKVEIIWGLKQNYRYINDVDVFSYIAWQFLNSSWIKVNDNSYKIEDCIFSRIDNLLEPLLVVPDIGFYIKDVEGSKSKKRREYEDILKRIGVVDDFSLLPIDKIYTVLYELPKFEGVKHIAKRFYKAMINSDIIMEEPSKKYNEFIEGGMVLSNNGYKAIKEVSYLDGKGISEKIAKKYNIIEIPRRQNSKKIKELLGVDKLNLKGEVVGSPSLHIANDEFKKDFSRYKVFAFCYRLDSANKDEISSFSRLEVILCTSLRARYNDIEIELEEFDFILKEGKTFYLKVPANLRNLLDMKQSVKLTGAISSLLCAFLDVGEFFAQFRELYGNNDNSRKELILQMYEDEAVLDRASKELNYSYDTTDEFMRIVSSITNRNESYLVELFKGVDFEDLLALGNQKNIIEGFKKIGIDIENYNKKNPSIELDLIPFYEEEIKRVKPKYEELYKNKCYCNLKDKALEEKGRLVENFTSYDALSIHIDNSVHYNCEEELINSLDIKSNNTISLVKIYNENKDAWIKTIENVDYVEEFLNSKINMSYLYFNELGILTKAYEEFRHSKIQVQKVLEETEINSPPLEIIVPITKPLFKEPGRKKSGGRSVGYSGSGNKEGIGYKGEERVYNNLIGKYPSLKWVSENGKKAGINPEGSSGYGYDMEYIDSEGERKYIEVKASSGKEIAFVLTQNEYNFGMKNKDNYIIYFVPNIITDGKCIYELSNVFKDNDINMENYECKISSEYHLSTNIIRNE